MRSRTGQIPVLSVSTNLKWDSVDSSIPITVVGRADASGTTKVFSQAVADVHAKCTGCTTVAIEPGLSVNWPAPLRREAKGNEGVLETVSSTKWSIGYATWANKGSAGLACAGLHIDDTIVTIALASTRRRRGGVHGHHVAWLMLFKNYVIIPRSTSTVSANQPRESTCTARRWLHAYMESLYSHTDLATSKLLNLSSPDISDVRCPGDRRLGGTSSSSADPDAFACPKHYSKCNDIKMVGHFPSSFPSFKIPNPQTHVEFGTIVANTILLSCVALLEHVANAKLYSERNGYQISISMDLIAVGLANIFGSAFGSFIVAGGFSRSALNARAATQMSGFFSVFVSLIVVFAMAPLLSMLPDVVLNVVLFAAVISVVDWKTVVELLRLRDRGLKDILALSVAFIATAFAGVVVGMMMAIGFSLVVFVFNSTYPQITHLRREAGSMYYEPVLDKQEGFRLLGFSIPLTKQARRVSMFGATTPAAFGSSDSMVKIFRFEAPLWFANVNRLSDKISVEIHLGITGLVLDMSTVTWVDVTACTQLKKLLARIMDAKIHLVFVHTGVEVKHMIQVTCQIEESRFFQSTYQAEMAAEMWGEEESICHRQSLDNLSANRKECWK